MKKESIITSDLRLSLKEIMKQEIEKIPELLEKLTPIDRLNMVCKIMRKKAANECVKFNRLVFSDKTVDKEGFVSFNLNL